MIWTKAPLEELCVFIRNGKSIQQSKDVDGLPITRIETIASHAINATRFGYAGLAEHDVDGYLLEPGDILFSHINSLEHLSKCAMYEGAPEKLVHGMNLLNIRPNPDVADARYVLHMLRAPEQVAQFLRIANKSVNQASISAGNLKKVPVPLPPLPDQRRIAAILDKADALRAKRREAIAKLDQLLQSVFLEMFGDPVTNPKGWPEINLSSMVNEGTIVTYGIVQAGGEFPGGIPYIRTGDIVGGEISEIGLRRTDPSIAKKFARSRVETGDIVMSIRATVGTTALVPESLHGANLTQGTARISVGKKVNNNFALHHLRSVGTQRWIQKQVKGATFSEITLGPMALT